MKKKILFIMPSLFIGGAERSLLGLLEAIDYSQYDVSLFLYRHEGEFYPYIPKEVHIIPPMWQYGTFDVPIQSLLFSKEVLFGLSRIFSKLALRLHCLASHEKKGVWMSMQYTSRFLQWLLPPIPGKYDLAVMFLGVSDVLNHKVDATRKVAWNHTDYRTLFPNKRMDIRSIQKLDALVSVSESCTEVVKTFYPEIQDRAITIENILAKSLMEQQAGEPITDFPEEDGVTRLLSIGRFSHAKNFDNVPDICQRIRAAGWNIKWYLIGYGGEEALIRRRIAEAGMQDYVTILGKKDNPYPYIKSCDLYVQPSRYEGKCVAVREAQLLGRPVVITRYATSASQLEDGVDGVIVPMDNEGCAAGIAALLRDPEKMRQLSENCTARDYSNAQEVEKLYKLMED